MANTYSITIPITYQHDFYPMQISALCFDPVSDVLWAGNDVGQIGAFYRNRMRGVAFPAGEGSVSAITASEHQIYAMTMTGRGLGSWGKGGLNKWHYRTTGNTVLSTFAQRGNTLVGVSDSPEFLVLNPVTGNVTRRTPCSPQTVRIHVSPSLLLSGSSDGMLRTHDLRTAMKRNSGSEHSVRAHQGSIQAIESSGNWIYTIGWSTRNGRPVADPLVRIFDTRSLRSMTSFNFVAGPSFINVHPQKSTTLVLASNTGVVNMVDVLDPGSGELHQLDVQSYLTSSAISPTGTYIGFGDANGVVHLLSATEDDTIPFNGFEGQPVEWADEPAPLAEIEWTDKTPLNSIGMPYYSEYLLSSYDRDFQSVSEYYPPRMKIPPQIMNNLKEVDGLAFAQMPRELQGKRNVVATAGVKRQGRFRSDRTRNDDDLAAIESPTEGHHGDHVPRIYQRTEIEYSKFGVEDFDFGFYNKTPYSGLETHILNSYTNALVQAMHYIIPLRQVAKSHITTACAREYCLLCELGFVMRMLEDARGTNCQATNFCKTIPNILTAATYGVVDYVQDGQEANYGSKIQLFNRFLTENLKTEANMSPLNPSVIVANELPYESVPSTITQLLAISSKSVTVCNNCKAIREKPDVSHIVDLTYPRRYASNEVTPPSDFASILRNSLLRDYTHKATCQFCKQLAIQQTRRPLQPQHLPPVLLINASVHNAETERFWLNTRTGRFLKPFVGIDISTEPSQIGGVTSDSVDSTQDLVWYELRSMVIEVKTHDVKSHLVALVKVPNEVSRPEYTSPWFIFNDFTVRNISEDDALSFPGHWKAPAILYFERVDIKETLDLSSLPLTVDQSILNQDISLSAARDKSKMVHEILGMDELPKPGFVVAIDAEFVQMQQEETEIFNDGSRRVLRPARLGLARVSVLRGSGPKEGVPFIDDYIHTSEEVVNYLTEFSGIVPGDLNPHVSTHTLVPLKVAYKKLRLLIDLGCIFIGHGLSKDFRIINIFVPPEQVIDTVDLYFIKERQRRISLRFLTWYILQEDIQQETHDSIEDARSALLLYKKYQEFEEQRIFDTKLEEIYRAGREHNWKPPNSTKASPPAVNSNPTSPQFSTFFPRNTASSMSAMSSVSSSMQSRGSTRSSTPISSMPHYRSESVPNTFQPFSLDSSIQSPYTTVSPHALLGTSYSLSQGQHQSQIEHQQQYQQIPHGSQSPSRSQTPHRSQSSYQQQQSHTPSPRRSQTPSQGGRKNGTHQQSWTPR